MDDVLLWVMGSTVAASRKGLREWALNGVHFACERVLLPEKLELDETYGAASLPLTASQAVEEARRESETGEMAGRARGILEEVTAAVARLGGDEAEVEFAASEECERELAVGQEEEEKLEMQMPADTPFEEIDWENWRAAL